MISNTTDPDCHRGVVIYVKKYLNATKFFINEKRLKEYVAVKCIKAQYHLIHYLRV